MKVSGIIYINGPNNLYTLFIEFPLIPRNKKKLRNHGTNHFYLNKNR